MSAGDRVEARCEPGRIGGGARTAMLMTALLVAIAGCAAQPSATASAPESRSVTPPTESASTPTEPASTPTEPASPTPVARPHVTAIPGAPASAVVLQLVAEHRRWDVDTLTVPAGMTWTLELDNRDGPPKIHNFGIVDGPSFADRIFLSPHTEGPIMVTYEIPGLPAGTYEFVCTVHLETMRGTLIVQ